MNKYFIYEYISKLNKNDIINYSNKLGIILNENDLDVIYYYIKNEHKRFFNNPQEIFIELQSKVSSDIYRKLEELYNKYKKHIC